MGETIKAAAVLKTMLGVIRIDKNDTNKAKDPPYCASCHASESKTWVEVEGHSYCSQQCYDKRFGRAMEKIRVPKRFWSASFDTLSMNAGIAHAIETARKFADLAYPAKGLFVYGSVGSGKTHLMSAVIRKRIANGFDRVGRMQFWPMLDLMAHIKREWSHDEWDPQKRIKAVPLLFIDDLGMEIVRDWTYQEFLALISYRYNGMLPTCITSNLNHEEFLDRYGNALFSRISEMCDLVKIEAPDYRLTGNRS